MHYSTDGNSIPKNHHFLLVFLIVIFCFIHNGCTTKSNSSTQTDTPNQNKNISNNSKIDGSLENLKIFRGHSVYGHEVRSFTLCGSSNELWVIDATEGDAKDVYARLTTQPYQAIFVEIKGSLSDAPTGGFGADYSGSIVFEKLVHASRIEDSWGCREKYNEFIFKAQGNEPGWTAIISNNGISFSSSNHEKPLSFPLDSPQASGNTFIYITKTDENSLRLTFSPTRCADTMADELFGWKADVVFDGKTYKGCAKRGDQSSK
ncbi:hypothetical protein OAN24_01445 [Pseudodesulfovibrio sp.]|nr:hypothetical protein [Pseudodesulfovibrio sp.]